MFGDETAIKVTNIETVHRAGKELSQFETYSRNKVESTGDCSLTCAQYGQLCFSASTNVKMVCLIVKIMPHRLSKCRSSALSCVKKWFGKVKRCESIRTATCFRHWV